MIRRPIPALALTLLVPETAFAHIVTVNVAAFSCGSGRFARIERLLTDEIETVSSEITRR